MAFKNKDLSVIAYASGFTWWQYASSDDFVDSITGDDKYFEKVKCLMNTGDVIVLCAKEGTAIRYIELDGDLVRLHKLK